MNRIITVLFVFSLLSVGPAWADNVVKPDAHWSEGDHAFPLHKGFLGVHVIEITDELSEHYGISDGRGVLVAKVEEASPAEAARAKGRGNPKRGRGTSARPRG